MQAGASALLGTSLFAGVLAAPFVYAKLTEDSFRNLRAVQPGVLYRSGQLDVEELDHLVQTLGLRSVVSFRDDRKAKPGDPPPDAAEEAYCVANGIAFLRLPSKPWSAGDGGPPPAEANVTEFLQFVRDRRPHGPMLIHCFAGIHRTGTYAAIYRMEFDGWSNADALAEMRSCGYTSLDDDKDIFGYLSRYRPGRR